MRAYCGAVRNALCKKIHQPLHQLRPRAALLHSSTSLQKKEDGDGESEGPTSFRDPLDAARRRRRKRRPASRKKKLKAAQRREAQDEEEEAALGANSVEDAAVAELFVIPLPAHGPMLWLPGMSSYLNLSVQLIKDILGPGRPLSDLNDMEFGLFLTKPTEGGAELHDVGEGLDGIHTGGVVVRMQVESQPHQGTADEASAQASGSGDTGLDQAPLFPGGPAFVTVNVSAHQRIKALHREPGSTAMRVTATLVGPGEDVDADSEDFLSARSELQGLLRDMIQLNHPHRDPMSDLLYRGLYVMNPGDLADQVTSLMQLSQASAKQLVLDTVEVLPRLRAAINLCQREVELSRVRASVNDGLARMRRREELENQARVIRSELGEGPEGGAGADKQRVVAKLKERLGDVELPEAARTAFDEELAKLQYLEPHASDYSTTRNFLDWMVSLPWDKTTQDSFNLGRAERVLAEDHYGMEEVKTRVLELIAAGKLRNELHCEGKVLCLVGPPGTGKTSIGKSVARAVNREFYRFSVGGLAYTSEIKGHRRTYIGSMPGKPVQALKATGASNPVVLIDEIDKMGRGADGDPASALLEVLDPEQNDKYLDLYLDVPVDLSKVLWLCTANSTDDIPAPLLDRMEIIRLPGYVMEDKVEIAKKYLIKNSMKAQGLKRRDFAMPKETIKTLITDYCMEAGVRSLKQHIDRLLRKVALKMVRVMDSKGIERKEFNKMKIESKDLVEHLGRPRARQALQFGEGSAPPGVVTGLAWNSLGGTALYIEAALNHNKLPDFECKVTTTGRLGDVMQESSEIALSYAQSFLQRTAPGNGFFHHAALHIHVPEGATPKDGPSAGVALTVSLVSLASDCPVPSNVAMTGEITLTGRVLAVGGIQEKVIAAKQVGVEHIILPQQNKVDWDMLPAHVTRRIKAHFVSDFDQAHALIFGELAAKPKKSARRRRNKHRKKGRKERQDSTAAQDRLHKPAPAPTPAVQAVSEEALRGPLSTF